MFNLGICDPLSWFRNCDLIDERKVAKNEEKFEDNLNATYGVGIGLYYDGKNDGISVGSIATNGPAFECDLIKVGDVLVSVDGMEVACMKPSDLGPLLQGPHGSQVYLEFRRTTPSPLEYRVVLSRLWSSKVSPV